MSCSDDFSAMRHHKQPRLPSSFSSQRAGPSTRLTRQPRNYSSTSLSPYNSHYPQASLDNLLEPLDIILDSDLDQRSISSATPPSTSLSPATSASLLLIDATSASPESKLCSRSSESRPRYPLREPGQMTAQRIQRLRARTAAVITSLPATLEEVVDEHEEKPLKTVEAAPTAHGPKLRRVSGVRDLRRAFRDSDHGPVHFSSCSTFGISKDSYELGFLVNPTPPLSLLSLRSSSRTLVGSTKSRPQSSQSSSDLKTLRGSTFSSLSIASRFASKVPSTLSSSLPSHTRSPSDTSQSILSGKYLIHSSLTPLSRRHASLQLDSPPSDDDMVWSCAKISQSAVKRAARRGHAPRRVFSNPIAILAS